MTSVFTLLACFYISTGANAQRIPLACQTEKVAGLNFESGRWAVRSFYDSKFVLVQDGNSLTVDSVAKMLDSNGAICEVVYKGHIYCRVISGRYLGFDPETKRGTVAALFGGLSADTNSRDSLYVAPFVCQGY